MPSAKSLEVRIRIWINGKPGVPLWRIRLLRRVARLLGIDLRTAVGDEVVS